MTAYVYQEIHRAKGAANTTVKTPHGSATLTAAAPSTDWLELARKIAYDDSVAYEIQTFHGMGCLPQNQWWAPGNLNSSFSPEDLCSNYLGTVVAASALNSARSQSSPVSFGANVDREVRQLLLGLGPQSATEARKAFNLINGRWVSWTDLPGNVSAANPYYLKRRNFTYTPWLAGLPTDQPRAWTPTPFNQTSAYTYKHTMGITNADFPKETAAITAWAKSKFGPDADKP